MIITIIFYLYSDTGPHIVRGPLRPLTLVTFAKKMHFLSFSNILDFLEFFHIFLTIFPNRTATPLRIAATLRIARYVAFWRQAATPAATAIFILGWKPMSQSKQYHVDGGPRSLHSHHFS